MGEGLDGGGGSSWSGLARFSVRANDGNCIFINNSWHRIAGFICSAKGFNQEVGGGRGGKGFRIIYIYT